MAYEYLTDAPVIRVWWSGVPHLYQFDTVKNRYYFTKGPPFWQMVNARSSGDFVGADHSVDQEIAGFQLSVGIAFDICAAGVRPASIETPPRAGISVEDFAHITAILAAKGTVEFYPHGSMLTPNSAADDRFKSVIEGEIDGNRGDGQQVTHLHILWKGTECVSNPPTDF